jgi:iron complex transport system ATP-binding protein
MISFNNISIKNKENYLLKNINFSLNKGITAVIGPNGAGKSTLLTLAAGIIPSFAQNHPQFNITIENQSLSSITPSTLAQKRAMLTQHQEQDIPLSNDNIIKLGLWPHCSSSHNILNEAITVWGLQHLLKKSYSQLSGGEKQRIHIARTWLQLKASSSNEKLWILDEPQTALDLPYQQKLISELFICRDHNWSVLLSTHDINFSLTLAEHWIFMKNSEIIAHISDKEKIDKDLLKQVFDINFLEIKNNNLRYFFPEAH